MSKLEKFIQSLDEDHTKVVAKWEARQKIMVATMWLLGVLFLVGAYSWVSEAALGVNGRGEPWVFALILFIGGTAVAILWELGSEGYAWSRTLVDAGRCVSYENLLYQMNQYNRPPKSRPLYCADYELLKEHADAVAERKLGPAEQAAAARLGQLG
ncbi:hypothetical protein [Acidovorax sp.]|uniref:hypothetical protein n=1 Tax=Acidovorax sp. TaxID=1872122 RepID=UPI00391FC6CE